MTEEQDVPLECGTKLYRWDVCVVIRGAHTRQLWPL